MRRNTYVYMLLSLIASASTTRGSVTFQNLPTSPTQLFSGLAIHGYLIHDLNGGHFIKSVATVTSTSIAGNIATTTYTYPETPDTEPYPYMSPTGPIYFGGLYPAYIAGSSQESLVVGASTLLATADWNFSVPSQELSNAAGISFNMTVTNVPAQLSLEQDIDTSAGQTVDAVIVIFNQDTGDVFANYEAGTYLDSYQLSLNPGNYRVDYSLYDHNALSGHYSISVVPEVSSAWLVAGIMIFAGVLHRRRGIIRSVSRMSSMLALVLLLPHAVQSSAQASDQIDFQLKERNLAFYKSTGFDSSIQVNGTQGFANLSMPGAGPLTGELAKEALIFNFTVTSDLAVEHDPWIEPNKSFSFAMNFTLTIDVPLQSGTITTFDFAFPTLYFTDNLNDIPVNPNWLWVDSRNGQDTWIQMRLTTTSIGSEGYLAYATTDISAALQYEATGGLLTDGTTVIEKGFGSISYTAVPEIGGVEFSTIGMIVLVLGYALRRRFA